LHDSLTRGKPSAWIAAGLLASGVAPDDTALTLARRSSGFSLIFATIRVFIDARRRPRP
jgi:hypothetical protein